LDPFSFYISAFLLIKTLKITFMTYQHTRLLLIACIPFFCATVLFGGTLVMMKTPAGEIDVELFDDEKPITVSNFLSYVESGAFEGTFFERWAPGFVIQSGGFVVSNHYTESASLHNLASGPTITNEYTVGQEYSNIFGTIAMARGSGVNSASASWFINLGDNAFLDSVNGGFTVFGQVVRGTNVLNKFQSEQSMLDAMMGFITDPHPLVPTFEYLPVATTNNVATLADLVYTEVEILKLDEIVSVAAGGQMICWNSVSNANNHIEYKTSLTSTLDWMSLVSTNGTGERMCFVDENPLSTGRVYRITIDFE
jgi:cyclophilin family peptidyl-prolyl cis-trans isomerase